MKPPPIYERWFGRSSTIIAIVALFAACTIPPEGLGISVCWMHAHFHIPCPGCGLTRALACAVRGMFSESVAHHPFGLPLLVLFAATAVLGVLPARLKHRSYAWVAERERWATASYVVLATSFVAFGAGRALWVVATW